MNTTQKTKIQNPYNFTLSKEQEELVHIAKKQGNMMIDACAGAAKTTSMVVIAHNIKKPSLYLTFNKKLATEAASVFPEHVECRTVHSLAFRQEGVKISHKLNRPRGKYVNVAGTGSEIAKYFKINSVTIDDDESLTANLLGFYVKETLSRYEASANKTITKKNIPCSLYKEIKRKTKHYGDNLKNKVTKSAENFILKAATQLWNERINTDSVVLSTHDTYIKMWELTAPLINTQILYVDEVQDVSMAMVSIIKNQVGHCQIIAVGDVDQNIYSWRHSVNALKILKWEKCLLTKSFRFGQQVADLANLVLNNGKSITGTEDIKSVVEKSVVNRNKPYTELYRTNSFLLDNALERISEGFKVNISIDTKDYISMLKSTESLYLGDIRGVKHRDIIPYTTFDELLEESKHNNNLNRLVHIVIKKKTAKVVSVLSTHKNTNDPDITMITAHAAKGSTIDSVILADDFGSIYNKDMKYIGIPDTEKRLLYVALTRAKYFLNYNNIINELIEYKP